MTYLPQANCRLTSAVRGASEDDYDTASVVGASVFAGDVDAYLSETARLVPSANALNRVAAGYVVVSNDVPVEWQADDVLTLKLRDGTNATRQVRDVRKTPLAGVGVVGTTKLYLRER